MPPPDIMAQLGPGFDPRSETWIFARHRVGDYYHHLNFSCGEHTLCWCDEQSPPRLLEHGVVPNTAKRVIVTEEHEIYWTVDQVQIDLSLVEGTWPALAASGSVSTMLATLLTLCASLGLRAEVTESGRLRLSEVGS